MTRNEVIRQLAWRLGYLIYSSLILGFAFRVVRNVSENPTLVNTTYPIAYATLNIAIYLGGPTFPISILSFIAYLLVGFLFSFFRPYIPVEINVVLCWFLFTFGGYLQWFWLWPRKKARQLRSNLEGTTL